MLKSLDGQFKDKYVTWGILPSFFVGLGAFIGARFVIAFIVAGIAGSRGQSLEEFFGNDNYELTFMLAAAVSVVTAALLMLYVKRDKFWRKLGVRKVGTDQLLDGFMMYFFYFIAAFALNALIVLFFPEANITSEQDTGFENAQGLALVFAFITLVLVAPFFEELLFRGFIFRGLAKATAFWPAALTSSLLFGLAHATSLESNQIALILDTFLVGMAASYLVWRTNSILPGILLHGIKNLVAFVLIFIIEVNTI